MRLNLNTAKRCEICRMHTPLCICQEVKQISTKTRLIIAMHIAEKNKPSSSARLLKLALPNSEIRYEGLINEPLDTDNILSAERDTYLLYPEADLKPADLLKNPKPINLLVPDGTWQQAKKIAAALTLQLKVPRLSIPGMESSNYKLRVADRQGRLSTLEAVARVLEVLEGPEVRQQLERLFQTMVERVMISRNGRKAPMKKA